ncbi:hypothetical protein [Maricaulis sp.]|uniref:hypothetical protein n=1 Tax=Maricaulis sp. TaxID=1486257 RepID=UPI000C403300|nr:hypothetical protein [Maricaulis sp.]MAC89680.1 hypothetical protein [Maricaulis sp.]
MNTERAIKIERWLAGQFHTDNFRGGFQAAAGWPDSPIKPAVLAMVGRGERRLRVGDALWLCARNDRADLLRALADLIDAQDGPGAIAKLAHSDVYVSADLARTVDEAEEDGHLSHREILDIRQAADVNLQHASELHARSQRLTAGPVED